MIARSSSALSAPLAIASPTTIRFRLRLTENALHVEEDADGSDPPAIIERVMDHVRERMGFEPVFLQHHRDMLDRLVADNDAFARYAVEPNAVVPRAAEECLHPGLAAATGKPGRILDA